MVVVVYVEVHGWVEVIEVAEVNQDLSVVVLVEAKEEEYQIMEQDLHLEWEKHC